VIAGRKPLFQNNGKHLASLFRYFHAKRPLMTLRDSFSLRLRLLHEMAANFSNFRDIWRAKQIDFTQPFG
jgi:hypothetical protein